jgi:hypothetical protein
MKPFVLAAIACLLAAPLHAQNAADTNVVALVGGRVYSSPEAAPIG